MPRLPPIDWDDEDESGQELAVPEPPEPPDNVVSLRPRPRPEPVSHAEREVELQKRTAELISDPQAWVEQAGRSLAQDVEDLELLQPGSALLREARSVLRLYRELWLSLEHDKRPDS